MHIVVQHCQKRIAAPFSRHPEVESEIREAISFHLDGLREDGVLVPPPSSLVKYLEVAA
jgi:hypothetical protein